MPETLFLEQHINIVIRVTLQSFLFICSYHKSNFKRRNKSILHLCRLGVFKYLLIYAGLILYRHMYTLDLVCVDQWLVELCYSPRMGDELLIKLKIV